MCIEIHTYYDDDQNKRNDDRYDNGNSDKRLLILGTVLFAVGIRLVCSFWLIGTCCCCCCCFYRCEWYSWRCPNSVWWGCWCSCYWYFLMKINIVYSYNVTWCQNGKNIYSPLSIYWFRLVIVKLQNRVACCDVTAHVNEKIIFQLK